MDKSAIIKEVLVVYYNWLKVSRLKKFLNSDWLGAVHAVLRKCGAKNAMQMFIFSEFAQKPFLDKKKPLPVNFLCYFTKNSDWISLHVKFVMYI